MRLLYELNRSALKHDLAAYAHYIEEVVWPSIRAGLKGHESLFIFGAGMMGQNFLKIVGEMPGVHVRGFVDSFLGGQGRVIMGLDVLRLEDAAAADPAALFVVANESPAHQADMLRQCAAANVSAELYYDLGIPGVQVRPNDFSLLRAGDLIDETYDALADESSRKFLIEYIYRTEINLEHYFLTDLIDKRFFRSFADVGAFTGDTFEDFKLATGNEFNNYYMIESLPAYCDMLRKKYSNDERISFFPYAASDKAGPMELEFGRTTAQCASETLDVMLAGRPVTMIKMDIEGMELRALKGARNTILAQRPVLILCYYHHPRDIWELPLWIRDLNCGYAIHLRHPGHPVCIAIPR